MLKSYLKQDNVASQHPHNIILFELDLKVKFPLYCLLQFLSDLKELFQLAAIDNVAAKTV